MYKYIYSGLDSPEQLQNMMEFVHIKDGQKGFEVSPRVKVFMITHNGTFSKMLDMTNCYCIDDFIWTRPDYERPYYDDVIVVAGHTPTQLIWENPKPGYLYKANNHIAMDCGACLSGGRLAGICLETGEEFYSR